jgi:hypothetical protein
MRGPGFRESMANDLRGATRYFLWLVVAAAALGVFAGTVGIITSDIPRHMALLSLFEGIVALVVAILLGRWLRSHPRTEDTSEPGESDH